MIAQLIQPVTGHHLAGFEVGLASPVEITEIEREAAPFGRGRQNANRGRRHFAANSISRNAGDGITG